MTINYMFILIILALVFGVNLASGSQYVNKYKNRYFIYAVLVNIGILISEVGTYIAANFNLRFLHILCTSLTILWRLCFLAVLC